MKQYVDKSAVVAEIEELIKNGKLKCQQSQENNDQVSYIAWSEHIATCGKILSFLDTLEVKEVDLEKEWKEYFKYRGDVATVNLKHLARHFFELGLKTNL